MAAALVLVTEGVFLSLNRQRASRTTLRYDPPSGPNEFRLTLGYQPLANASVSALKEYDGAPVYDVTYTFDEHHRRVVPAGETEGRTRFIALFGCSYAFGEGLDDDETLACHLARLAPSYRVYNYAHSGYGPQQTLVHLGNAEFANRIPQDKGVGIYILIPHHVRRAIGSMRTITSWGRHFPNYVADDKGGLVLRDTFKLAWPWRMRLYKAAAREQVARYFNVDWPVRVTRRHVDLTCRILKEAADAFHERFGSDTFYVVAYPRHPTDEFALGPVTEALRRTGVKTIDLDGAFDWGEGGMLIPHDLHPSAMANERIAEMLVKDLGLNPLAKKLGKP